MKLVDTTNPACNVAVQTILNSASVGRQLELLAAFHVHLLGFYYAEVGAEWSTQGKSESDYLHHIEIALSGRRQTVFRGEIMQIEPGNAYWFPGNTPLERRSQERCQVMFLKLRSEWLPGVDPLLDWPDRRPALICPCDVKAWRTWLQPANKINCSRLLQLQARILEWIAAVVPDLENVIDLHLKTHARFKSVFSLIENKLGANLRVEELARVYGTTLHAFSMAFTRDTGMSPKAYIKRRLNQEAIQLLSNTELKLKEVADRLNFFDEFHFSRYFAKTNGVPPSEYRRALMSGLDVFPTLK